MSIINGVTVDFRLLPRVITIPDTETEVSIEDLQDTLLKQEDGDEGILHSDLRKTSGLNKQDKIELYIQPAADVTVELEAFLEDLKTKVGASKFELSTKPPKGKYKFTSTDKIKGNEFTIHINKL